MVAAFFGTVALLGLSALLAPAASAQDQPPDLLGVPDSVFNPTQRIPFTYMTTYDRGNVVSSWTQTMSWGLSRKWLSISTDAGTDADRNLITSAGRGTSAQINGQVNALVAPRLVFSALGHYESTVPHGVGQGALQRRNRIQLRGQYEVDPNPTLMMRVVASTEFRRDFDQAQEARSDTLFLKERPDTLLLSRLDTSGRTTGRQDGASGQLQWKPTGKIEADLNGSVSRAKPEISIDSTFTGTFAGRDVVGNVSPPVTAHFEPLTDFRTQGNLGYSGPRALKVGASLRAAQSGHVYIDPDLKAPERWSLNDRNGALHVEQAPVPGLFYSIDGSLGRTFNEFATRISSTSFQHKKGAAATVTWNRTGTLLTATFNVLSVLEDGRRLGTLGSPGLPDSIRNGTTVTRFLTGNGSRRLTSRLSVDGVATASLNSYSYWKPINDQDIARTFVSLGGGYTVSRQCSLTVHFSSNRGFNRFIDASNSGGNYVTNDYQMLAVLNLRATEQLSITQNYLLSASYRILDDPNQDDRNSLLRNRRIDTIAADTLFPFAFVRLTHNFLFQDAGPYIHEAPGQDRHYIVSSETYAQSLEATLGVKPLAGILFLVTQKLGNSRTHQLSTGARTVQNRWGLTGSMEFNQTLPGGAALQGAVRHIGEYTETPPECRGPNPPATCFGFDPQRSDYWVAGVSLQWSY